MVREGDERAFDEVYARYRDPLHRYCHSIVRQREDAEEAYQATMLAAFQTLSDPDGPEVSLRPWLYRIAHNACVSVLRRRPADPLAALTGLEPAPGGVEERSEVAADLRQLRQDLGQLSEGQRAALVMRELGGLGHEEIGRAIGEDAAIVKQLIYNARLALHDLAAGREMACHRVQRTLSDGDRRVVRGRGIKAHVRACPACASWQEAMRTRPVRLAALAPMLPAMALHELLAAVGGAAATGAGAIGAAAGGGGIGAAAGGAAVGAAAAGATAGVGAGAGAGLIAQVAILGSTALVGGTAVVPAFSTAPVTGANHGVVIPPLVATATGAAPLTTPAAPVGGELGAPVRGTAHADLAPKRDDSGASGENEGMPGPSEWTGGEDDQGEAAEASAPPSAREDEDGQGGDAQELAKDRPTTREMQRDEDGDQDGAFELPSPPPPAGGQEDEDQGEGGDGAQEAPAGPPATSGAQGGNGAANGAAKGGIAKPQNNQGEDAEPVTTIAEEPAPPAPEATPAKGNGNGSGSANGNNSANANANADRGGIAQGATAPASSGGQGKGQGTGKGSANGA
ncbi:MAG: hypothetical protein QOD86_583 [Miltoncostaeaceae bacterium]|nr:hypothetical protein [Miltoncostaeaceae bacterium]